MPEPSPVPVNGAFARLYAVCLGAADSLDAHRVRAAIVGVPLVVAALAVLNQHVLLGFPNSGDEYVYLFQAQTLSEGRLSWPASPFPELFATNYVASEDGRTFGTFPPGWPLALAFALVAGLPAWLVNPMVGAATLLLVWTFGAQLYGPRTGVIAAALLAVSPFFAFNSASYFSHPWCAALLLGAACLAARTDRRPWWVPVLCGSLLGWAVLARYFTGVVCAAPIVWWIVRPGVSRLRTLLLLAAGGVPWVAGLMAYNQALSGSAWQLTTTALTTSRWFADGFVWRGADILASHVVRHLLWTPPVLVAAYLVYLRQATVESRRGLFAWLPAGMAALLFFYMERGGNQYGARFHYEVYPFLLVFVVGHLFHAAEYVRMPVRDRRLFAVLVVSVAVMPVAFIGHAVVEREVIRERMHPFVHVSALGLSSALVLVTGRVGTRRSMAAGDLTRNDQALDPRVLFGLDPGAERRCAAAARLPGRTPYLYRWDTGTSDGVLTPLACP